MRPKVREESGSKIPALSTLSNVGWEYLPPADARGQRKSKTSFVLRGVLAGALGERTFEYGGVVHALSAGSIDRLITELSSPATNEGLLTAAQQFHNQLTLGITVTEFIAGKRHNVTVPIIDWNDPSANSFHVTEEFPVLNAAGTEPRIPDIVCFVNGLPLVVIEAKRPGGGSSGRDAIDDGISQMLRNQKSSEIPQLFAFAQLLLSIDGSSGRYGTTRTPMKFWSQWREEAFDEAHCEAIKNQPLPAEVREQLLADRPQAVREHFEALWSNGDLAVTDQDRLLIGLLAPERLLEFVRFYLLYDVRTGRIAARYPQFFGTRKLLRRIEDKQGKARQGGVIWHTTGSGKSLTMVFLCRALLMVESLKNCRLIVVTDRVDLERQLADTFGASGAFGLSAASAKRGERARANTGTDLARRIAHGDERILFTLMQKFVTATREKACRNDSADIIVLIDEGHRSQSGENHERMRQALPNAAFVAFTGTPLLKKEKTVGKFGPILHAYTMQRAVEDQAVAPLLYEERKPDLDVNDKAIDHWFKRLTGDLSEEQQRDLKRQYARRQTIHGADHRIELIAWDIATHFRDNFKLQGLGLKGQVATDSKLSAIRYHEHFERTGLVTSAVIISPPDTREGHANTDESDTPKVQTWWQANVTGNPETYEKEVLARFTQDGAPDLLIVVDKLLTGFDEPRNTVLYIDKPLREHNLIQAIARVNRLHQHKRYGYLIDYRGVLDDLDTSVKGYQDLAERTQNGYDIDDLKGLYRKTETEYRQLPRLHDALWDLFDDVENRGDLERYRQALMPRLQRDADGDEFDRNLKRREDFYEALSAFGQCLKLALSSSAFFADSRFTEERVQTYKSDLKWFDSLRAVIRRDAEETVDYSDYEPQVRRLVDTHVVGTGIAESPGLYQVDRLGQGDPANWSEEKTRNEADLIRSRVTKTIEQSLGDDPYAQKAFSELLREAIAETEALFDHPDRQYAVFQAFEQKVRARDLDVIPAVLRGEGSAAACYGVFPLVLGQKAFDARRKEEPEELIELARSMDATVRTAMAEHSLDPSGRESAISKGLLPLLFRRFGMVPAREMIDRIIGMTRAAQARSAA